MSRGVWEECGRDGKKDFIVFICISRFRCNLNLSSFLLLVALKGKGKKEDFNGAAERGKNQFHGSVV